MKPVISSRPVSVFKIDLGAEGFLKFFFAPIDDIYNEKIHCHRY